MLRSAPPTSYGDNSDAGKKLNKCFDDPKFIPEALRLHGVMGGKGVSCLRIGVGIVLEDEYQSIDENRVAVLVLDTDAALGFVAVGAAFRHQDTQ